MTDKLQTKQLDNAYQETSKLVDFLVKREWYDSPELLAILERTNTQIVQIADQAITAIIAKLEGSYLEEAQTEANKIRATALKLRSIK